MANEKTPSYLSIIKEVPSTNASFSRQTSDEIKRINYENQRAFKLALKKDYQSALDIFNELENTEMVLLIKNALSYNQY